MRTISGLLMEILPGDKDTGFKDKNGKSTCFAIIEEAQQVPLKSGSVIDKLVPVAVHFWDWRATPLIEGSANWIGQVVSISYENYSYKTSARLIGKEIHLVGTSPSQPPRTPPQAETSQSASKPGSDLPF